MTGTAKRTVTTHTRADGNKQTANRLGGKFDDKNDVSSAAADVFAANFDEPDLDGQLDDSTSVEDDNAALLAALDRNVEEDVWGSKAAALKNLDEQALADRKALWDEDMPSHERDQAALRHMRRTLTKKATRRRMTPEEFTVALQDSLAFAANKLQQHARSSKDPKTGEPLPYSRPSLHLLVRKHAGLVNAAFGSSAQKVMFDERFYNANDISAMAELQAEEELYRQVNGEEMPSAERTQLASDIRMKYPAGKRPHEGYENFSTSTVSTELETEDGYRPFEGLAEKKEEPKRELVGDNEVTKAVEDSDRAHAEKDKGSREIKLTKEQKADPWNTYAKAFEGVLPFTRSEKMKKESATRARAAIADYPGGVAGLAEDIQNDDCPNPNLANALFSPFGKSVTELKAKQRAAVLESLAQNGPRADLLWNAALKAAS